MNEVFGLNQEAWNKWAAYKKQLHKKFVPASIELAQKKLAQFGEHQMQVVERSIEHGWSGLFPLPKAQVKAMDREAQQRDEDARVMEELRVRAQVVRFRIPKENEPARDYRIALESAERSFADEQYRRRLADGPRSLKQMLRGA